MHGTPAGFISRIRCARSLKTDVVEPITQPIPMLDPKYAPPVEFNVDKWAMLPNYRIEGSTSKNLDIMFSLSSPFAMTKVRASGINLWMVIPEIEEWETYAHQIVHHSDFNGVLVIDSSREKYIARFEGLLSMYTDIEKEITYLTNLGIDWETKTVVSMNEIYMNLVAEKNKTTLVEAGQLIVRGSTRKPPKSQKKSDNVSTPIALISANIPPALLALYTGMSNVNQTPAEAGPSSSPASMENKPVIAEAGPALPSFAPVPGGPNPTMYEEPISAPVVAPPRALTSQDIGFSLASLINVQDRFDIINKNPDRVKYPSNYEDLFSISNWKELLSPTYVIDARLPGVPVPVHTLSHYFAARKAIVAGNIPLAKSIAMDQGIFINNATNNRYDFNGEEHVLTPEQHTKWLSMFGQEFITFTSIIAPLIPRMLDILRMTGNAELYLGDEPYDVLTLIREANRVDDDEYSSNDEYSVSEDEFEDSDEVKSDSGIMEDADEESDSEDVDD